ncbi:MAG: NAD(P)H-dependent glycerol-3-phosphate dehydrogenase [Clostridia bacterium]
MKITIIGTGAYGIALAKTLHLNNNEVSMYTKFEEEAENLNLNHENNKLLPNVKIPLDIVITTNLEEALLNSKLIVMAVPSNSVRDASKSLNKYITKNQIICIVTKGIEIGTLKLMSEVVSEEVECNNICVLSGPSFAGEVAIGAKLGLIAASDEINLCNIVKSVFENKNIKVEISNDIIGVQVCASAKNAFAIIMGAINLQTDSTRATMLTILLNDLKQILNVLGGKSDTIYTYAGIGDFLLTCMNEKSRNFKFGTILGKGNSVDKCFEIMGITTVEGIYTLNSIYELMKEKNVHIKSIDILYDVIYNNGSVSKLLCCLGLDL